MRSFLIALFLCIMPIVSYAETSMKDIMVAVRTLGFVSNPPVGRIDFAVIYDPSNPLSVHDKDNAYAVLDGGTPVGQAIIRTMPFTISEIDRIKEFKFVLLTSGIDDYIPIISKVTKNSGILTITTNLEYVRKGYCVMGVVSEPTVKVLINRQIANNNGISFAVFFRMMIMEIGD